MRFEEQEVDSIRQALLNNECPAFEDIKDLQKSIREAANNLPAAGSIEIALIDGQRCSVQLSKT